MKYTKRRLNDFNVRGYLEGLDDKVVEPREHRAVHLQVGLYPIVTSQSTAQPLYTGFPIIFKSCFSNVTVGFTPTFRSRSRLQLVPLELAVGRPPRIPSVSRVLTCRRRPDHSRNLSRITPHTANRSDGTGRGSLGCTMRCARRVRAGR
jgi:hypothetical protein